MLGPLESVRAWQWAVCGKHPAAKDYFHLGKKFPLTSAFSDWVEKGYGLVASRKPPSGGLFSWRFWAAGYTGDYLACGIVRDSSDSIGRPYPLMILGTGPLKNWQARWHRMPDLCEKTWSRMESISARPFRDLRQLEDEISRIRCPGLEGAGEGVPCKSSECTPDGGVTVKSELLEGQGVSKEALAAMSNEKEILVSLNEGAVGDYYALVQSWHDVLRGCLPEAPKTVFIGGSQVRSYLALFRRPLMAQDFVKLWTLH